MMLQWLASTIFTCVSTAWKMLLTCPSCVSQDESPEGNPQPTLPAAIINVSAHTGIGLEALQAALGSILPGQAKDRQSLPPVQVKPLKEGKWF